MTPRDQLNPTALNASVWARGSYFRTYATSQLRPVEEQLLSRYRRDLSGRVLELGCGAGRLTSHLVPIAQHLHGIDLSPRMIAHCRRTLPEADFALGDFRDVISQLATSFDVVVAPCNVLDVCDDADRRATLDALHGVLSDGGLLIMSSHNRGYVPKLRTPTQAVRRDSIRFALDVARLPRRMRHRRRLLPLERDEPGYAIINDGAHDFSLLHYFTHRNDQQRQFAEHSFDLLECLTLEGQPVGPEDSAPGEVELHYVARRSADGQEPRHPTTS